MVQAHADRIQQLVVKQTADGSPTLYVPELNEHYHSVHGALQESEHVFIKTGLTPFLNRNIAEIKVFEVGFGTGLNAALTFTEAVKTGDVILYHTIEAYPLPAEVIEKFSAGNTFTDAVPAGILQALHQPEWDKCVALNNNFRLHKMHVALQEANLATAAYHVIYFDAFAPEKQPELWEEDIFQKLWGILQPGGLLVTYCAKGIVKRRLRAAGFKVETLPGPPGKREMIRAVKQS